MSNERLILEAHIKGVIKSNDPNRSGEYLELAKKLSTLYAQETVDRVEKEFDLED